MTYKCENTDCFSFQEEKFNCTENAKYIIEYKYSTTETFRKFLCRKCSKLYPSYLLKPIEAKLKILE